MVVTEGFVGAPVLEALFAISVRPSREDAYAALNNEAVRTAAIRVAQKMRHIAIEEDNRREEEAKKKKQKPSLINYRRFYVGGVGIGLTLGRSSKVPYEWWTFPAYNTKVSKNDKKFCAEMRIMRAAREVTCACIGGFVVVGENQPDGRSGKLRKTLDPCGDCRDCMRHEDNAYLLSPNTLIVTSQPLSQLSGCETLRAMMRAHGERWP
jgi:hypothetical protein